SIPLDCRHRAGGDALGLAPSEHSPTPGSVDPAWLGEARRPLSATAGITLAAYAGLPSTPWPCHPRLVTRGTARSARLRHVFLRGDWLASRRRPIIRERRRDTWWTSR